MSESKSKSETQQLQRQFAVEVVETLRDAGYQALWAGGCVRDSLLDRIPGDYDVATSAHPEQVRQVFGKRRTLAIGAAFGVIVVLPRNKAAGQIEVATFRSDGQYVDGRRPESVIFSSPEEDAQRRDFTINGMFYDPLVEKVIDYVGGEADLKRRLIRAIGDPVGRMTEDKLRMLRAVRFASTLGFELDRTTDESIRNMADQITIVSVERITQELRKMLTGPDPARAMELSLETGLLPHFLPELSRDTFDVAVQMLADLSARKENSFACATACLFHGISPKAIEKACRRLKLSNADSDSVKWLVDSRDAMQSAEQQPLCRLKRLLAHSAIVDLLMFVDVYNGATDRKNGDVEFCRNYLATHSADVINPPMLLTGDHLIEMGMKPGKQFKQILDAVRDAQLDETISTPGEAREMAEAFQTE